MAVQIAFNQADISRARLQFTCRRSAPVTPPPWCIIDGQVHVWAPPTPERPWRADADIMLQRADPLGVDELSAAMDSAGVGRAILVPPMWEGPRNDLALAAAAREPGRYAVMGRLDVEHPWSAEDLARWQAVPGMLGARLAFNRGDKRAQLERAAARGFFAAAEIAGLPLMLFVPGLVPEIGGIAARHPGLRIIIDHLALDADDRGRDLGEATAALHHLKGLANVAVKASALPCFVADPPGFDRIRPLVYDMIESFGADRVFWGSDLSRLPCAYGDLVRFFTDDLDQLSDAERRLLLGEGIGRWLDWPIAAAL
jgi:L-fuconolactonase